ncbi:MAG: T9SS type A sorting domain-containing protein [Chitinophagales bacterium]|nr:T9SS type A sorting domain-containing protein [Chitinophagales bacterium]
MYCQDFSWGKSGGNTGNEYARSIFVDGAGSVYTVGSFSGTVDFDPGSGVSNLTAVGSTDAYIQKLNSAGAFVFARRFGGAGDAVAYGVTVDPNNFIYITGSFTGNMDSDPNAGTSLLTSAGGTDIFLIRLSASAVWSYSTRFGSTGDDVGLSVCANAGAFALTGTITGVVDFDPGAGVANIGIINLTQGFIARYVPGVFYTFAHTLGISANASEMDVSGNIYTTGVGFNAGSNDAFVKKFGPTGTVTWTKYLGGASGDGGYGIATDVTGNVYTTGFFSGTADFDPDAGVVSITSGGSNDIYVSKLDTNGSYVWAVGFSGTGDDRGVTIDTDPDGNVYTAGYFRSTVDFDPGAGVSNLSSSGLTDGMVCKLNASGQYVWAQKIGSTGNDAIQGIRIEQSANIHLAGYFSGTVDVDPAASVANLVAVGGTDYCVVKWIPCIIPAAPTNTTPANNLVVCNGESTVLSASGTGTIGWYSSATGGTYLGGGSSFTTPVLTSDTSFYVQDSSCLPGPRKRIYVSVLSSIANQTVSSSPSSVCVGQSATVSISGSEVNKVYSLRDNSNNAVIDGPIAGTGAALNFSTGAINSTTTYNVYAVSQPTNYALDLDGVDDYIDLGTNNRGITSTVTVSAKVKAAVTGASQFIVSKYVAASLGFYLYIDATGKAAIQGRDAAGAAKTSGVSTTVVADNQWHEVTGVVRNTGWEIWVDGVLENSGAYSLGAAGLATTAGLLVGYFSPNYSTMDVDHVAIWNTALSTPTIAANNFACLTGSEANLVGYFKFNEGTGTVVNDLSSSALNGSLVNMTAPACWISGSNAVCMSGCDLQMANTVTISTIAAPAQPTITPSGSTVICSGGSVTLTSSPGTTYLWSTGATTSSITVSAAGTYSVQVTNAAGCQSVPSAGTTVTIGSSPAQPTISAGGPTTFCAGGSVTLTSSAGTSYLWSNGATTASINVTNSGTYTVQVTNASGCQSVPSAGTTVTVNSLPAQPTITAGGPTTFCAGGSVTLTSSAGTTYLWSNGATTASISPTTSGTYTVQVTNAAGCQSVASAGTTVTVNSLPAQPTITAGGPTTFCAGGSVTLTSSAGTTYLWSNGATTASISPTTSGTYTVRVTNAAGCQSVASAGTTVTVNSLPAQPTITAGGPTTFCAGGSVTLTSSAGTTYLWSNGATTASISPTTSGTYTVQVTNAAGCQSVASAGTTVTVNSLPAQPTITAGGPTTFCAGGSVTLTSSTGTTYLWSNGATTASISPTTSGTYTVQVTNAAGCQSVASAGKTVTVNSLPGKPTVTAGGPTTFCAGGSVTLTSSAGTSYLWSSGATTASISPTTSGTYTVRVTNAAGCQSVASDSVTVTVNTLPTISLGTVSNPTSCTVDNGSVTIVGSGNGTLTWSGAANGSQVVSNFPDTVFNLGDGNYSIYFTDGNGCVSSALNVTLTTPSAPPAPTITAGGPTSFCPGGSVTLTASNAASYLWSTGDTTASITVMNSGNYSVGIIDAQGCASPSSNITTITVFNPPVIAIGSSANPTTCLANDGSVEIVGSSTGDLSWTGQSSGSQASVVLPYTVSNLAAGNYTFSLVDSNGCTSANLSHTLVAPNAPAAPTITASGPLSFCEGNSVTLSVPSASAYAWSNGDTSQSIVVTHAGSFSVNVTDTNGCTSLQSATTIVWVDSMPDLTVTNTNNVLTATQAGASYNWIDCATGNSVGAANAQSFTPSANGSYAVIITKGTCADTSACVQVFISGINEESMAHVSIQPNPGLNEVSIVSDFMIEEVAIYSTSGGLVQREFENTFNVQHLASGVYFVQVKSMKGTKVLRFVKQ